MKSTPFQIILLAIFGAAAVVGVLVFAILTSSSSSSTAGPVVIWGTLDEKVIGQLIQDSTNGNENLAKVTYVQKDPSTFENELTRALAGGTGPDLIFFDQDIAVKDLNELSPIPYTEMTASQFQNIFIDAANPLLTPDGIAGFPILADPLVMYWNKDLLASAGLTQPPAQWSQLFTSLMQSLNQRDDSGSIKQSLIALGEYDNVDHAKDILSTLIMQAGGTVTVIDSATGLPVTALTRQDPTKKVPGVPAESALRFYTEFADASKNNYAWNHSLPSSIQAFTQGSLALYLGLASEESVIAATNPNLRFAVARVPQSTASGVTTARVYALGICRGAQNPVGAKIIAYTLATKQMSQAIAEGYHMVSARRDALQAIIAQTSDTNTSTDNARNAVVGNVTTKQVVVAQSATIAQTWADPDPQKTDVMFRAMIEDVTSGATQITEAVSRANAQLLAAIDGK